MTAALEGGEWSAARPGRTLPLGKTRYPFYRRLSGPQGRSERAENLVPTGIRSRTVEPVAQSLYLLSYRAHIQIYVACKIAQRFESYLAVSSVISLRLFEHNPKRKWGIYSHVTLTAELCVAWKLELTQAVQFQRRSSFRFPSGVSYIDAASLNTRGAALFWTCFLCFSSDGTSRCLWSDGSMNGESS